MAFIFNVILPVLAAITILAAVFFIGRAFIQRGQRARQPYGLGQQESRRAMQVDFIRGFAAAVVGLLLLLVSGLGGLAESVASQLSTEPTRVVETIPELPDTETETTPTATATAVIATTTPTATPDEPPTTPTPTATPTSTPQPEPETAVVQSGVGVWLRSAPDADSEQLEWLLDGTVLTLLPGRQMGSDFEWQEVRAPSGQEGWVAVEFIVYDTDLVDEPEPENDNDNDNGDE
ncbi:MAG: SH3 domain-containing protein [Chloroflexota bacterium]